MCFCLDRETMLSRVAPPEEMICQLWAAKRATAAAATTYNISVTIIVAIITVIAIMNIITIVCYIGVLISSSSSSSSHNNNNSSSRSRNVLNEQSNHPRWVHCPAYNLNGVHKETVGRARKGSKA